MTMVEIGACAPPREKTRHPDDGIDSRTGNGDGQTRWSTRPIEPPPSYNHRVAIEGPKTPPDPPDAIVNEVVRILTSNRQEPCADRL